MKTTKRVALGEVAELIRGVNFTDERISYERKNDYLPLLRAGNIQKTLNTEQDLIWVDKKIVKKEQIISKNDIVICTSSSSDIVGKVAICENRFIGTVGAFCAGIRANNDVDPYFIYYWFKSNKFKIWRDSKVNGATIQNLRISEIAEIQIPLPPLDVQKQIAVRLEKADEIRRMRRYAIELSERFLQEVFIDMFGDPVKNPKGWDVVTLGDEVSLISSGITPLGGEKTYLSHGVMFIRSQNVLMNKLDLSDVVYISDEQNLKMKRTILKNGDVLLNITGASIGRVALYDKGENANVNQHVCIIRLDSRKVKNQYLVYLIANRHFQYEYIYKIQAGATREGLNFEQIRSFSILSPPLELQNKFASIVQQTEQTIAQQREALRQSELLFSSLLNEAFEE